MKIPPISLSRSPGALPSSLRSRAWAFLLSAAAILTVLLSIASSTFAGSATWLASPATGDWNFAANWTAGGPPNGSADTATFASSNITGISLSGGTEVNGIVFNAGASAFAITASPSLELTISGAGITNNSAIPQNFVSAGSIGSNNGGIQFTNSATAGNLTVFTNNAGAISAASGGSIFFNSTSSAGNATIINNGGLFSAPAGGGETEFALSSSAGSATITNKGGMVSSSNPGVTFFINTSSAGSATITNNATTASNASGGATVFCGNQSSAGNATITNEGASVSGNPLAAGSTGFGSANAGSATITNNGGTVSGAVGGFATFNQSSPDTATITNNGGTVSGAGGGQTSLTNSSGAGNATLIANGGLSGGDGGSIQLQSDSNGGTARIEVFGNGNGDSTNGNLDISGHNPPSVTVGSIEGNGAVLLGANNLIVGSNNLSTPFSGLIQGSGSFTKTGTGTLTLTGANTYTGGTIIQNGKLLVTTNGASATGTGAVLVNAGTLAGTSRLSGAMTVGTGSGTGASLAPGVSGPGVLTTRRTLTFNSDATYVCELTTTNRRSDQVVAKGATINTGALFSFVSIGNRAIPAGTVFTVINNTAATPIVGIFSNLADNSTFTAGRNTYRVSYEGGTGNDLTLTVQ